MSSLYINFSVQTWLISHAKIRRAVSSSISTPWFHMIHRTVANIISFIYAQNRRQRTDIHRVMAQRRWMMQWRVLKSKLAGPLLCQYWSVDVSCFTKMQLMMLSIGGSIETLIRWEDHIKNYTEVRGMARVMVGGWWCVLCEMYHGFLPAR